MAAPSVAFDGTRLHTADASGTSTDPTAGDWTDIGGAGAATEPDFIYQGTGAVSEKVSDKAEGGVACEFTATVDYATGPKVWIAKAIVTNKDSLNVKGSTGGILEIGSGGLRSAYDRYYIVGSDTYPIKGGWLIIPIDPNGTPSATPGTAPTLSAIDYYGFACQFGASSKAENVAMDAIDYVTNGTGLTLTAGEATSPIGTFQDFIDEDEGNSTNRWGIVTTQDGILYVTGVLTIGTATETHFSDTGKVVVFPDAEFLNTVGFYGLDIGLQSASTDIAITGCVFNGRGSVAGSVDTRPDYSVTGTSGNAAVTGSTFDVFRNMTLTTGITLSGCILSNGLLLTQGGGTLTGCAISNATTGDGVAFIQSDNPAVISGCDFTFSAGHAIEITAASTYAFSNNTFTGYGADETTSAAILNDTGGEVTLNLAFGDTAPTVLNISPSTTVFNNSVDITLTIVDSVGAPIQNAQCYIEQASDQTVLLNVDSDSTGTAETTFNFLSDTDINIRVRKSSTGGNRFVPFTASGTIQNTGFSLAVRLTTDSIASA